MNLYEKLLKKDEKISVTGLGYVGMPLAVLFAQKVDVIGFDLNKSKIELYKNGIDPTNEVGNDIIKNSNVYFTNNESDLKNAKFHIVAVPTPINLDKTPNLEPVENASRIIARNLTKDSIVVYESTVYPGVTENVCIPILEEFSGLKCGVDFKVGYSPERINPGDKNHKLENIVKIVSGIDNEALNLISDVYKIVISAGVHEASSIKVAEAAKVVENSQRDINIAFMNELAMVFDKMNIDSTEVIEAMNTKWNALKFSPGLVGGHCIGVDPYYFIYEAERLGYHSQIILSGRKINDGMGQYISNATIKKIIDADKLVKSANVYILGLTFKENCPDIRNSKVVDIYESLKTFGIKPKVVDHFANKEEAKIVYDIDLVDVSEVKDADCIIVAVAHDEYKVMDIKEISKMYRANEAKILIDVKSIFKTSSLELHGIDSWRL